MSSNVGFATVISIEPNSLSDRYQMFFDSGPGEKLDWRVWLHRWDVVVWGERGMDDSPEVILSSHFSWRRANERRIEEIKSNPTEG